MAAAFYGQVFLITRNLVLKKHCSCRSQAKFTEAELKKVSEVLDIPPLDSLSELGEHWWPNRGLGPMPPTDPVIYRLYEVRVPSHYNSKYFESR